MTLPSISTAEQAYIDRKVFSFLVSIDGFTEAQTKRKLVEVYREMVEMDTINKEALRKQWGINPIERVV